MKIWLAALLAWVVCVPAFADGPGKSRSKEQSNATSTLGQAAGEVVNAAVDELDKQSRPTTNVIPSKRDLPPGLEKKGKTPPGWSKGKKKGWDKDQSAAEPAPKEGILGRMTRIILRKDTAKPSDANAQ